MDNNENTKRDDEINDENYLQLSLWTQKILNWKSILIVT